MEKRLKEKLNYHYKAFDRTKIEPDPLQFLHGYKNPADIEFIGFTASVFAYGSVKQIIKIMEKITGITGPEPLKFLLETNRAELTKIFSGCAYRFYTSYDVATMFVALKSIYEKYGLLKNLFLSNYNAEDENLRRAISAFRSGFIAAAANEKRKLTRGFLFMLPDSESGSACKRMNLFLRWMVRKDELDFGLWSEIPPSKLVIPVDTHVARICKQINLTKRKNSDWKMAEEITANLKICDSSDPVKYDFAICHIGMRGLDF
jgi:uncharacterized protein (TIGR02757 family)